MCKNIGICGMGFVGGSCSAGFSLIPDVELFEHDKYKDSYNLSTVVENCKIIFLCLPTPTNFETGKCDTSIVESVCKNINKLAKSKKILVIKSTLPPSTTQAFANKYKRHAFIFNPEFLREKTAIQDFLNQDRIILGKTDQCSIDDLQHVVRFYEKFIQTQKTPATIKVCKSEEAEMTKNAANTFLATKIAYFNEIYRICQAANINYNNVRDLMILDKRIGESHTSVPGHDGDYMYGGKCFPKDQNSLMFFARSLGVDPMLMESVWCMCLLYRKNKDWEEIPGATTGKGYKKQ